MIRKPLPLAGKRTKGMVRLASYRDGYGEILAVVRRLIIDGDQRPDLHRATLHLRVPVYDKLHGLFAAALDFQRKGCARRPDRGNFAGDRLCGRLSLFARVGLGRTLSRMTW